MSLRAPAPRPSPGLSRGRLLGPSSGRRPGLGCKIAVGVTKVKSRCTLCHADSDLGNPCGLAAQDLRGPAAGLAYDRHDQRAGVAQLVAHSTCNRAVRGSSPLVGSPFPQVRALNGTTASPPASSDVTSMSQSIGRSATAGRVLLLRHLPVHAGVRTPAAGAVSLDEPHGPPAVGETSNTPKSCSLSSLSPLSGVGSSVWRHRRRGHRPADAPRRLGLA